MRPGLDAAIFDFDGTLVDTMPLHYEAYRRTFADVGIELSEDDYYGQVGGTWRETIPKFLRGRPCSISPSEIHERKQRVVLALFEVEHIPQLAVTELLPLLHGRTPMAIASSGSRASIELIVRKLDWTRFFDAIVTGEDVARGKPAPDLFLLAAERLDIAAPRCLVFEDNDDGIRAARAAGMHIFDVRTARSPRG